MTTFHSLRTRLPLTALALAAATLSLTPGIAAAGYDISSGQILTVDSDWITIVRDAQTPSLMRAMNQDYLRFGHHTSCDAYSVANEQYMGPFHTTTDDREALCQFVEPSNDTAVWELYESLGVHPMTLMQPATAWTDDGDNSYNTDGSDGSKLTDAINNLDTLEAQLFGDAEIYVFRDIGGTRQYRVQTTEPTCYSNCTSPTSWSHSRLAVDDGNWENWATGVGYLFDFFDLGEFWNSNLYYLDFSNNDNNADSYFKNGIAATVDVLEAVADDDPLTAIFMKVSMASYPNRSSDGIPGNEQPLYIHFATPESGDIASLGNLSETTYSIELVPGTYSVVYNIGGGGEGVPHNTNAILDCAQVQ